MRRRKLGKELPTVSGKSGKPPQLTKDVPVQKETRPGRPSAFDATELLHRRSKLQGLFQAHWPTIGWNLLVARTRTDIAQAFRPLADFKLPTIDLLLVETNSKSVQDESRKFRAVHKRLDAEFLACYARLESCRSLVLEARDAYSQARVRLDAARDGYVFARKEDKPTSSYLNELKKWPILCNRLRLEVKQGEENVNRCTEEFRRIQIDIRAIEAHFAQTELLRFLRRRNYAFTPENVANAAAGLPHLGCRRSFLLCSRVKYAEVSSINYLIFDAVSKIVKKQNPRSSEEAIREIRRRISTERQFSKLNQYLSDHWPALGDAARKVWKSSAHPRSRAFQITSLFLEALKSPKPVVNPLLDALRKDLAIL